MTHRQWVIIDNNNNCVMLGINGFEMVNTPSMFNKLYDRLQESFFPDKVLPEMFIRVPVQASYQLSTVQ